MHCKSQNAEQALWNQTLKQAEITLGRKYPSQGPEFAACTVVLVCIDSCVPDWLNRRSCFEKLLCALEKRWRLMGECGDGGGECTRSQGRWKLREANGSWGKLGKDRAWAREARGSQRSGGIGGSHGKPRESRGNFRRGVVASGVATSRSLKTNL